MPLSKMTLVELVACYFELLLLEPSERSKLSNQHLMCDVRDTIVAKTGMDAQEVQDMCEEAALKKKLARKAS